MYDPIHANRHGVVSVPRTDRTCNTGVGATTMEMAAEERLKR